MSQILYSIYKHTNQITGKVYIGQTCLKPEKRWNNGQGYSKQPIFYQDIQKYGWENFKHEILEKDIAAKDINDREKYWISYYQATNPEKGYNQLIGGSVGYIHTKQQKQQISQSLKQYYQTDAGKSFMKIKKMNMQGENNPNYGNHSFQGLGSKRSKPVYYFELNRYFGSVREAARMLDIKSAGGISQCCLGRQKKANGYTWRFATLEEILTMKEEVSV